ncbi:MAG: hypothetical protein JWM11_3194 [Planctomycetaceae bacterium]|nr:hypothetical protein [Planctomycetaceae bacterium]
MSSRIYQVCLTYLTRRGFWACAACCAYCCNMFWSALPTRRDLEGIRNYPAFPKVEPEQVIDRHFVLGRPMPLTRSIKWKISPTIPLKPLTPLAFPKVVSLEIVGTLRSDDDLVFLEQLPHLQILSIPSIQKPESLQYLAGLKDLQYLRFSNCQIAGGLHHLSGLTKLQTLVLGPAHDQERIFDELPGMKSLETLVFNEPLNSTLSDESLAKLRELPRLRIIQLQNDSISDEVAAQIGKILPDISINPATPRFDYFGIAHLLAMGVCFSIALKSQLRTQFLQPEARLIPNFAQPHFIVAGLLWGTFTLIDVILLYQAHPRILTCVAFALLVPGIISARIWAELRVAEETQPSVCRRFFDAFVYDIPYVAMISFPFQLTFLDWFFRHMPPIWMAIPVLGGILFPFLAMRRLYNQSGQIEEIASSEPQSANDPSQQITARTQSWAQDSQSAWTTAQSQRFDAVLAKLGPRNRSRLWIAGQFSNGKQLAFQSCFLCILFSAGLVAFEYRKTGHLPFTNGEPAFFLTLPCLWLDLTTLILAQFWSQRRPMLGCEFLRPMSREQFIRQIFAAVAWDLAPLMFIQFLAGIALVWFSTGFVERPGWILAVALCFILRIVTFNALTLFALINRNSTLTVWVIAFVYSAIACASYCLFPMTSDSASPLTTQVLGLIVALCFLLLVRSHWAEAEFD